MAWRLQTARLTIRRALPTDTDVSLLVGLWNDPRVMRNVGFPEGLGVTMEGVRRQLAEAAADDDDDDEFEARLVAVITASGDSIGECKLGRADEEGIAHTDVKLRPEFQGRGFGTEIKRALLDYQFRHTDCVGVRATPNRENTASIRMQEAVGGRCVGEGVCQGRGDLGVPTTPVHYLEYLVTRDVWSAATA